MHFLRSEVFRVAQDLPRPRGRRGADAGGGAHHGGRGSWFLFVDVRVTHLAHWQQHLERTLSAEASEYKHGRDVLFEA